MGEGQDGCRERRFQGRVALNKKFDVPVGVLRLKFKVGPLEESPIVCTDVWEPKKVSV